MRYGKYFQVLLLISLGLIYMHCYSQEQPVLSVQSFEYIWQKEITYGGAKEQIIFANNDSVKHIIEKSFARAIQQRWNIESPQLNLSVKPLSVFSFSGSPKFNTKLKDKQPGTWYLFLQIFDAGNSAVYYNQDDFVATMLITKCKLVNNDSVIFDKSLTIKINKEEVPPDQIILKKLPAYPSSFVKAFDSIARWTFEEENVSEKNISLKPACIFSETKSEQKPVAQLNFESENHYINHLSEPHFSFHSPGPTYKKTENHKNTGGNIASGAITLFTGIHVNKKRWYEYNADFPFELPDSNTYHCIIHYEEAETAEREREKIKNEGSTVYSVNSGEYSLAERGIDSNFMNAITFGNDTLATFRITYTNHSSEQKSYTKFWDGSDSSTIMDLPKDWLNGRMKDDVILNGKIKDLPFTMRSINETAEKQFYINNELAIIIYGETAPVKALQYKSLSEQQLKLFTILSSIPYSYFSYSAY